MHVRNLCAVIIPSVMVCGCATTDPGSGAQVGYHLPRTDIDVAYDLTLKECKGNGFTVGATVVPTLIAGAQDETIWVDPTRLASATIKRDVKITIGDGGVITAVNTTADDQTLAIVGNVIKAVATVAPTLVGTLEKGPNDLPCSDQVLTALDRVNVLRLQISSIKTKLSKLPETPAGAASGRQLVKDVDALAAELAAITTGDGALSVHAKGKILLGKKGDAPILEGPVVVDTSAFDKWFGETKGETQRTAREVAIKRYFGLVWSATINGRPPQITASEKLRPCGLALTVPSVVFATFTLTGKGNSVSKVEGRQEGPVAQWAQPSSLCIDAGTGETRTVAVTYDSFGRQKEFDWSSNARAATIASSIAGSAPDAQSIYKTIAGKSDADVAAKLSSLKNRKDLNELEACQAVIESGGFTCPTPAKSE